MKKQLFVLAALLLGSIQTFAYDYSNVMDTNHSSGMTGPGAEGMRVSFLAMSPEIQMATNNTMDGPAIESGKLDQALGAALGYASLTPGWGWTGNIAYIDLRQKQSGLSHTDLMRADFNVAYSFTSSFHIKGGINGSKFTSNYLGELDGGVGGQASAGLQLNPHVGIDLAYFYMHQSGTTQKFSLAPTKIELEERGTELSIHATF